MQCFTPICVSCFTFLGAVCVSCVSCFTPGVTPVFRCFGVFWSLGSCFGGPFFFRRAPRGTRRHEQSTAVSIAVGPALCFITLSRSEALQGLKPERRLTHLDHFSCCSGAPRGCARDGAACASRPRSVRTLAGVETSSRDEDSSILTVSAPRWQALEVTTAT